jgi:hypothetical protein
MRFYKFEIDGRKFAITEGEDLRINGRVMTAWEVREDLGDAYHQFGNAYLPRRATKAQMRAHIAEVYAAA